MRAAFFIWIYGSLMFTGLFLFLFWNRLARDRRHALRAPNLRSLLNDRYYGLAAGVATVSLGVLVVMTGRMWGNIRYGLSHILTRGEGYLIGTGLVLLLAGLGIFVWLADLERSPPTWSWSKFMVVFTLAWAAMSLWLAILGPLTGI